MIVERLDEALAVLERALSRLDELKVGLAKLAGVTDSVFVRLEKLEARVVKLETREGPGRGPWTREEL